MSHQPSPITHQSLTMNQLIALIPARSGSKRIKNKNIKLFGSHPLIAYTIFLAQQTKIFSRIIVSTDNAKIAEIAKYYGAEVPFLRPSKFATDSSPDIEWLKYTLIKIKAANNYKYFSILRPTSPFRTASMIQNAWNIFLKDPPVDSIRAIEKVSQHPAKMWRIKGNRMQPVLKNPKSNEVEWFSTPMQALPQIYAQNSSLEISKCSIPLKTNSISGKNIIPFIAVGFEGYDINTEKDWIYARYLIKTGKAVLPEISKAPYKL